MTETERRAVTLTFCAGGSLFATAIFLALIPDGPLQLAPIGPVVVAALTARFSKRVSPIKLAMVSSSAAGALFGVWVSTRIGDDSDAWVAPVGAMMWAITYAVVGFLASAPAAWLAQRGMNDRHHPA